MINVLHIRDTGDMLGAESVILELAKHSKALGINSIIGVLGGSSRKLIDEAKKNGINTLVIPCNGKIDLKTVYFLKKYIYINNIHIVHSHGYKEDFYAWLSKSTPLVGTNHLWKRTTLALKIYAYLDSKILQQFNKIVAVSNPILKDVIEVGIPSSKSLVIQNGVDIQRFKMSLDLHQIKDMKAALGIQSKDIVIGMISSLSKEKGHAGAIKCFAELLKDYHDIHLLIVGAGEEKTSLIQLAGDEKILDKISFTGSRKDIPAIHQIIDVFLLNSTIEGLPMALMEAMASGKAVIATNVGDVGAAVINMQTGLLIPSDDFFELIAALRILISDNSKRASLGQAAKKHITDNFSSVLMAEKYVKLYHDLAK